MSKFVSVTQPPSQLGKGEIVIAPPDFLEQINQTTRRGGAPRNLTGINQLREILAAIQEKYQIDLNMYKIPVSQYEGISYETPEDLSSIVVNMLQRERPAVFEQVLEYNIKNRPYGTKLVYYVGRHNDTGPFFKHGLDMIEEKDVDEYLGRKPKKTVGKPAITKEEAEAKAD